MAEAVRIIDVRLVPAPASLAHTGLLGFVSCSVNGVALDGIAVRRSRSGEVALTFPERRDAAGRHHRYFRLLDAGARADLEAQVLTELRRQGRIAQ